MNPKITLTNPTADELDAAVAEHVAGKAFWTETRGEYTLAVVYNDPTPPWQHWDIKQVERNKPRYRRITGAEAVKMGFFGSGPERYSKSADAVLPLLAAHTKRTNELRGGEGDTWKIHAPAGDDDDWSVCPIWMHHDGWVEEIGMMGEAPTFPRAACIALLRANGVEVAT